MNHDAAELEYLSVPQRAQHNRWLLHACGAVPAAEHLHSALLPQHLPLVRCLQVLLLGQFLHIPYQS